METQGTAGRRDRSKTRSKARASNKTAQKNGNTKKKQRSPKKKRVGTLASRKDKYDCYQRSVQEPSSQCRFFERVFRNEYGRAPLILREDFCGTALVCCEWVKKKGERRAYGYDVDPEPLAWGEAHNRALLPQEAQRRVELVRQDVRQVSGPKADVISAENFSYFIFTTRDELRGYLAAARRNLRAEGVMVLDIMGGPQVIEEDREESRRVDGFTYVWEHKRFDPINNFATYFIHFKFRDGSGIKRAFRYDWRVWSIPELRELLLEAGFSRVDVYWEGSDEDGEGNGIFRRQKSAPADPAWIAYVVAVK